MWNSPSAGIDKPTLIGYNADTEDCNAGMAFMRKIAELLAHKAAYAVGAGSLFDFADVLNDRHRTKRRSRKTFLSPSAQDDWQMVGADLSTALHELNELTRQSRGA